MIIEEDAASAFLDHHGVKGMHWGIRNKRTPSEASDIRRKRRIQKTAVFGALAAGGLAASYLLSKHGNVKISSISHVPKQTISPELGARIVHVRKSAAVGSSGHKKEMAKIAADRLKALTDSNVDLKNWYNKMNVPIPKREFLDTSYWEKLL